jgi:glycosyltransferase involved in cell wall biosynthesis
MTGKKNKNEGKTNELLSGPFFTIVITTFNRALLLTRALDSLISQTEKDWEAIIVDDGSDDDTYCYVLPYLKLYSNIVYLRQRHKGEAFAKNAGLWSATGKYVTFLDSDDEFDPTHLASRRSVLMKDQSVKFLHGGAIILGNQLVPDRFDNRIKVNLKDCVIGGTFFIDRKTAILLGGLKDIHIGADAELFDRAKKSGINIVEVKRPTYIYHHETDDSITNRMINNML